MSVIRFCFAKLTDRRMFFLSCVVLLAACGGGGSTAQLEMTPTATEAPLAQAQPAVGATPAVASPEAGASQIDPCALLTGADVEAAVGRPVVEPKSEQVANLACCSHGDPEAPVFSLATLCVFVGGDAEYSAGAAAQARDAYELGKKNAASPRPVSGLGEDAYWDSAFETLHILQGICEISLEVSLDGDEGDAALQVSKGLAAKALQGLP